MSHNGSYDSPNAGLRLLSAAISPHIRGMSANQMIGSDLLTNDKLVETGSNWSETTNDSKVGKRRLFETEKVEECRNLEQLVEMVNPEFNVKIENFRPNFLSIIFFLVFETISRKRK